MQAADPGQAYYEPFVQGVFYTISEFSLNAPTDGTYYVAVLSSTKGTGKYGLAIGYLEGWTPAELALLSFNALRIYGWEGQNRFLILLPLMLTLILGGLLLRKRSRRGRAPRNRFQWLSAFSGLFFVGTALDAIARMLWSFTVARVTEEAMITLLIAAVPAALGTVALIYAMRMGVTLTFWKRLLFVFIGIIGLLTWCGLYVAPATAIAAGSVKQRPGE